ncbi:hypothetical protein [Ferrimonas balearica]|uniref:hypothetical protein n=1 Tax=Ferrimonas balearica TaxID=44012 RepID=UPI001C9958D5|nr:hypothetical protein [Ferrimonas balearica]MBY5920946.1 hypothetical protein [Ferrimonas balearica]MBY5996369.1 hypothetical protein [Ferrimonas balearica]
MLTAAIMSRLPYLSGGALNALLQQVLPESGFEFDTLKEIDYWPNFRSGVQTRVEPDVIWHFDWGCVVVEVKRPGDGAQCSSQWYRELESLPEEYRERPVLFLALGGNHQHNQTLFAPLLERLEAEEMFEPLPQLFSSDWQGFAQSVFALCQADTGLWPNTDRRVLEDILAALTLYRVEYREHHLGDLAKLTYPSLGALSLLRDWPIHVSPNNKPKLAEGLSALALSGLRMTQPVGAIADLGAPAISAENHG